MMIVMMTHSKFLLKFSLRNISRMKFIFIFAGVAGDSPLSMISRKPARPGGAVDKSPVLPTVSEIPTEGS